MSDMIEKTNTELAKAVLKIQGGYLRFLVRVINALIFSGSIGFLVYGAQGAAIGLALMSLLTYCVNVTKE